MKDPPTGTSRAAHEQNAMLAWLYDRFFASIDVDEAWVRMVRDADARGTVVYVMRSLSFVDFFALDYQTKRHGLPQIRFASAGVEHLGLWAIDRRMRERRGLGLLNVLRRRTPSGDVADLETAVTEGASAVLFLKRPPHLLEGSARGKIEGDHLMEALLQMQRRGGTRVLLVPQVFVWSRSPGTRGDNLANTLFGSSEWPGAVRSMAQFAANWRHAILRAGEPVDLGEFLDREVDGASDDVLVRRLTYTLLRRLERERRAIVGRAKKPADRLRAEVIRSPKLQKVIADMAGEGTKERMVITSRAVAMLREMEAALDMNAVAALDQIFARLSARMFSAIEVDQEGIERLREHAKEGTLVLLPSHKSHMDYLVLAWTLYRHKLSLPLIAAGDNLNFFPMGPVFRRAGAFFIRRKFVGDRLYAAVVDAYVRRLLKDGSALEFFLEGGRSRTGKLLPPKLGLLSIVVDAALSVSTRTTWFCPVSIGYERFVEEKAFVRELMGGDKHAEDARGLMKSVDVVVGRYGRLSVQFGKPLSLDDVAKELAAHGARDKPDETQPPSSIPPARSGRPSAPMDLSPARRRAVITRLAHRAMYEISAITAVTPGSLVATTLLAHGKRGLPHAELVDTCEHLARKLRGFGARFSPSLIGPLASSSTSSSASSSASGEAAAPEARSDGRTIRGEALREAIDLFIRAEHVQAHRIGGDVIYVVAPEARLSLDLAKNGIIHFFAPRALIATALLASAGPPVSLGTLRERVLALSRLYKYEFTFRVDAPFERIFDDEVAAMVAEGELVRGAPEATPSSISLGAAAKAAAAHASAADRTLAMIPTDVTGARPRETEPVELYARLFENFVEGYRIAARGLSALLRGPLSSRDLVRRAIPMGERMFLAGEIARREAVSGPLLENAYASFVDQGYLSRSDGKVALTASYATASAVGTIEARVAAMGAQLPAQRP